MSFHSPQDKSSNYLHLSLCGPLLICLPLLSPLSLFSPVYTLQFIQIFLNYLKTMIMPITIFSLPSNCSSFTTTHLHMIFTAPHFNLMNSSSHLSKMGVPETGTASKMRTNGTLMIVRLQPQLARERPNITSHNNPRNVGTTALNSVES